MAKTSWNVGTEALDRMNIYMRHIVALSWIDEATNPNSKNGPRCSTVSGFLMTVDEQWFWVTAGHICSGLEEMRKERHIHAMKFVDKWVNNQDEGGIPYPYELPIPHINNEEDGIDYGVVPLSPLVRSAMEAVGKVAIDDSRWGTNWPKDFLGFEMLGIPVLYQETSFSHTRTTSFVEHRVKPTLVPMEIAKNPPKEVLKIFPRFYATLFDKNPDGSPAGNVLPDINGMSGAPIFGLAKEPDGAVSYWLMAVQSGWFMNRRLICGCPIHSLEMLIRHSMKEAAKEASP